MTDDDKKVLEARKKLMDSFFEKPGKTMTVIWGCDEKI